MAVPFPATLAELHERESGCCIGGCDERSARTERPHDTATGPREMVEKRTTLRYVFSFETTIVPVMKGCRAQSAEVGDRAGRCEGVLPRLTRVETAGIERLVLGGCRVGIAIVVDETDVLRDVDNEALRHESKATDVHGGIRRR